VKIKLCPGTQDEAEEARAMSPIWEGLIGQELRYWARREGLAADIGY